MLGLFGIIGCIVAAAIGVALLTVGLRGRRVGDHPFCRRCGFDLFGKPPHSRVCPECGTSRHAPGALVTRARQRRKWALWTGAIVLLPSLATLSIGGYGKARAVDWQ